jgi:hypothetical protein
VPPDLPEAPPLGRRLREAPEALWRRVVGRQRNPRLRRGMRCLPGARRHPGGTQCLPRRGGRSTPRAEAGRPGAPSATSAWPALRWAGGRWLERGRQAKRTPTGMAAGERSRAPSSKPSGGRPWERSNALGSKQATSTWSDTWCSCCAWSSTTGEAAVPTRAHAQGQALLRPLVQEPRQGNGHRPSERSLCPVAAVAVRCDGGQARGLVLPPLCPRVGNAHGHWPSRAMHHDSIGGSPAPSRAFLCESQARCGLALQAARLIRVRGPALGRTPCFPLDRAGGSHVLAAALSTSAVR